MPGSAHTTNTANAMLVMTNTGGRTSAMQAVTDAASCLEAVNLANLLEGLDQTLVDEVHTVLDALPPAVDQALLTGLRSALDRDVPITVAWREGSPIGVLVEEHDGDPGLNIVLITPHGREYRKK